MNKVYNRIVSSYIKPAFGIGLMAVIVGVIQSFCPCGG